MRIRLKGINSVRKTLADGSVKVFYYAWKSGPPLRGEPGSPEFIASYNEAVARKVVSPSGALLNLLQQFQASQDFTDLAESTRRSYIALIKRIEKKFSDFPLSALKDRRARGIFKDWRDAIAVSSGRRQADYSWSVLARVLSWGVDAASSQLIRVNAGEGSTGPRGTRRSGRPMMRRVSSKAPQRTCICPFCWRYGPGNARATSYGFPGRPMTAHTFAFSNRKPGVEW